MAILSQYLRKVKQDNRPIRYFAQDESRFGLHTITGRLITLCGVKPTGKWQWLFKAFPDSINLIQVENGQFHSGQDLVIPENIILLFQPPYCPELNPIERLWEEIKKHIKWFSFKTIEQLQIKVDEILRQLTPEVVASITGFPFILDTLSALNTL